MDNFAICLGLMALAFYGGLVAGLSLNANREHLKRTSRELPLRPEKR